mgnify:CR=1 FL=1
MKRGTEQTAVIFRVDHEGFVFALLPEQNEGSGHCTTYEHAGGHSSGPYGANINQSRPAKPEEYAILKRSMENLGYNLKVQQRWKRSWRR